MQPSAGDNELGPKTTTLRSFERGWEDVISMCGPNFCSQHSLAASQAHNDPQTCNHSSLSAWAKLAISTEQADPFCSTPLWQLAAYAIFGPPCPLHIETAPDATLAFAEAVDSRGAPLLTPIETQ